MSSSNMQSHSNTWEMVQNCCPDGSHHVGQVRATGLEALPPNLRFKEGVLLSQGGINELGTIEGSTNLMPD